MYVWIAEKENETKSGYNEYVHFPRATESPSLRSSSANLQTNDKLEIDQLIKEYPNRCSSPTSESNDYERLNMRTEIMTPCDDKNISRAITSSDTGMEHQLPVDASISTNQYPNNAEVSVDVYVKRSCSLDQNCVEVATILSCDEEKMVFLFEISILSK